MKLRLLLPLLLAILACSAPGLGSRPTVEPLIFPAPVLETVTPLNPQDALAPTLDLNPVSPATPTPTVDAATATLASQPLSEIKISTDQVYYGGDCSPKEVTFEVTASQPEKVYSVILFIRLRNQKTDIRSAWNSGLAMRSLSDGRYEYRLRAVNVPSYKDYDPAWLQYQFVLTNSRNEVIARSEIFTDKIKFQRLCP
jgi:hypothetical protein